MPAAHREGIEPSWKFRWNFQLTSAVQMTPATWTGALSQQTQRGIKYGESFHVQLYNTTISL